MKLIKRRGRRTGGEIQRTLFVSGLLAGLVERFYMGVPGRASKPEFIGADGFVLRYPDGIEVRVKVTAQHGEAERA